MSSNSGAQILAGLGTAALLGLSWLLNPAEERSEVQKELDNLYSRKVQISSEDMTDAERIVAEIENKIKPKLKDVMWERHRIRCKEWMYTGSSYEGLKVIAPDEFDIMVDLDMSNHMPAQSYFSSFVRLFSSSDNSIYNFIPARQGSIFAENVNGNNVLHSQKVMRRFHSALQTTVNAVTFQGLRVWIGQDGPAMKIAADYRDRNGDWKYLKIDLVPAIWVNDRYHVAKPNRYDTTEGAKGKWRTSFSEQEKKKIVSAKEDQRKVLRIMKTFCKEDGPLAFIDSYYLKTVFLHMLNGQSWADTEKYFKDFLKQLVTYIQQRHLPHFSNAEYNLINHFLDERITVTNITRRIERLLELSDERLITILQRMQRIP